MYLNILHECSGILINRITNVDKETKREVFIRVSKIIRKLYKNEYNDYLVGNYKIINDIIINNKFELWLLLKYL